MHELDGQMSIFDLSSPSGKMFPAPIQAMEGMISKPSSKPLQKSQTPTFLFLSLKRENGRKPDASWVMAGQLPGEHWTRNFGEFPSAERESTLSQILVPNAPEKYYLSVKACEGIMRRAERRGKELPKILKEAMEEAAHQ